jgi:hypothetical protein
MEKSKSICICLAVIISTPVFASKSNSSLSELRQQNAQIAKQMQQEAIEEANRRMSEKKPTIVWQPPVMVDCYDAHTGKKSKCEIQTSR